MPKFMVKVEKRMYSEGEVEVTARNLDGAYNKVSDMIHTGTLQTTAVEWSDPTYEECSFTVIED